LALGENKKSVVLSTDSAAADAEHANANIGDAQSEATDALPDIPRYRILRLLGVGGMGAVYEAEQQQPKRTVALKVIKPGLVSRRLLRRFAHEAEILGRLQHPGIAQIYEYGTTPTPQGGQPFFAMEWVGGPGNAKAPTLTEYAHQKKLSVRQRLELMIGVADAVHYAHQKSVIHRDLKPANILVDESGQPKVLDFGVARITNTDLQASTMHTNAGQIIGTLAYMSPEQAAGDPLQMDTRSDIYALGVICYELLCGQLPYSLDQRLIHEVVRMIREDEPRPLSSVSRIFRGDIETIIAKALAKEKPQRYQSAAEFSADIGRYLDNEPIVARKSGAWYHLRKLAKRNRALVAGTLIALLALLVGIAGTTWQALRATRAQAELLRQRDATRRLAGELLKDVPHLAGQMTGTTRSRAELLRASLDHLDQLARDVKDDPTLQSELAAVFLKMGDVQGNPASENLNDTDGAMRSYQRALSIYRELARSRPAAADAQRNIAAASISIADIEAARSKTQEALSRYEQSLATIKSLAEADASNGLLQRDLAIVYQRIADMQALNLQPKDALSNFQKSLEAHKRRERIDRNDPLLSADLVVIHERMGNMLVELNRYDEALDTYQRGLTLSRNRAEAEPKDARIMRELSISYVKIGMLRTKMGKHADALESYQSALQLHKLLADADPTDARAQRDLSVSYVNVGQAHQALGRAALALSEFQESLKIRKPAAAAQPSSALAQRDLMEVYFCLAEALAALGDDSKAALDARLNHWRIARSHYSDAQALIQEMLKRGTLFAFDKGVPDVLAGRIQQADAALEALRMSNP
jgi:tetratricopeptide (TPR) repeat protein